MSGLAAGIRLAHFDKRVCILERHSTIGGLNSFYRLRGRNYDVGLHAVTNATPKGMKKSPLARLLRQLRMQWDDFALRPQLGSEIAFPGIQLYFDNNIETLRSEVRRAFPKQMDRFDRLVREIAHYDDLDGAHAHVSARRIVHSILTDPLLVQMLFCPLMYYGSAREDDMDWRQFSILFRSIFLEGLARPQAGIRLILKHLVRRFRALGGKLMLRSNVQRFVIDQGRITGVKVEGGKTMEARNVLSSAGLPETMRLCGGTECANPKATGQLSFCEAIAILDVPPKETCFRHTITFFNDSDHFQWRKPKTPCDLTSGVVCSPNNFDYEEPLVDGTMRITSLASYNYWNALDDSTYRLEKLRWYDRILASAIRFVPDFRGHIIDTDMFTPTTITRFTGHENGAVYGIPEKRFDGTTHLKNLFLCGTDQGLVGIIGGLISGITMANRWCLK